MVENTLNRLSQNYSNDEKMFYCELCDHVSTKLTQYLTHERSSNHIQSCIKYKQDICKDKKQLETMEKIIKQKIGINFKNGNELVQTIISIMCKQRLNSSQIKEARERKKIEEERKKIEQKNKVEESRIVNN